MPLDDPFVHSDFVSNDYWTGNYRCTRRWADSTPDAEFNQSLRIYRLLRGQVQHYGFVGLSREDAKERVTDLIRDIDWALYLASK
jgi:hypothetical protein